MRFFPVCAAACFALGLCATSGQADLVILDTTFPNGNWSQMLTGAGTVTSSQDSGFGNPSPSRRTIIEDTLAIGASGTSTSLYTASTYDPSATGGIASWTWTLDHRIQADALNITIDSGRFAVFQAGSVYTSDTLFAPTELSWQTATADQPVAALWTKLSGTGPTNPNFANGGTIQFGYTWFYTGVSNPTVSDEILNVDNFSLNLASVPEPGSMILLGLAGSVGAAVGGWRRCRRGRKPVATNESFAIAQSA